MKWCTVPWIQKTRDKREMWIGTFTISQIQRQWDSKATETEILDGRKKVPTGSNQCFRDKRDNTEFPKAPFQHGASKASGEYVFTHHLMSWSSTICLGRQQLDTAPCCCRNTNKKAMWSASAIEADIRILIPFQVIPASDNINGKLWVTGTFPIPE